MSTTPDKDSGRYTLVLNGVDYSINGEPLLKNLCLDLALEEVTIVLGANGAGKSLFLNLCHGLIEPVAGEITWCDEQFNPVIPPRQTMVFQAPVMLRRTALENVEYAVKQCTNDEVQSRAMAALKWAKLDRLASKSAHNLSAGEQQQLAIARAWAMQPELLFLDEPTSSLDPSACMRVEELIQSMKEKGIRIMMTTHNLAQAQRLAEQVVFLSNGKILEHQNAQTFFSHPGSDEARKFIQWESIGS